MPAFLRPQHSLYSGESTSTVDDAHLLMRSMYRYWYHKGFWGAACASLVDLLNSTILFSAVCLLTVRLRWEQATTCVDAECFVPSLFSAWHFPFVANRSVGGYCTGILLFVSTGAGMAYEAVQTIACLRVQSQVDTMVREMNINVGFRTPYHRLCRDWQRLVSRRDDYEPMEILVHDKPVLSTLGWSDFVEVMCAYLTREKKLRVCIGGASWDALRAVQTLLWEENIITTLQESGALEQGAVRYLDVGTIRLLLPALFDPFHTILSDDNNGAAQAANALHIRTIRYVQCYLGLYAFVVVFFLLKVLAKNAALIKHNVQSLKQYRWNARARWTFRLYNEVEHLLNCRLQSAETDAVNMISRLSVHTALSRLVRRASSTCVLTVIILSLVNPSLLVMGTFMGISLLWWLSTSVLLFASFPKVDPRAREYDYKPDLDSLVDNLYHDDLEWHVSGAAFLQHITHLFLDSVLIALLKDVLTVLLVPFVLLAALKDGSLMRLCSTLRFCCGAVDGVGSVPRGAMFDAHWASEEGQEEDESCSDSELHDVSSMRVDDENDPAPNSMAAMRALRVHNREKVTLSNASFMAVYEQWTLHRVGQYECATDSERGDGTVHDPTRPLFQQWQSLQRNDWTPEDAAALSHNSTCERDVDWASSAHRTASPAASQWSHSRVGTNRSEIYVRTGRSGGGVLTGRGGMTAHEREHNFVSAVRRNRRGAVSNRGLSAPPSPPMTAQSDRTYGT